MKVGTNAWTEFNPFQFSAFLCLCTLHSRSCSVVSNKDDALEEVISSIRLNAEKIWSSIEFHTLYIEMGGIESDRLRIIFRLKQDLEGEMISLKSPGTATIIMLKDIAEIIRRLAKDNDENNSFVK